MAFLRGLPRTKKHRPNANVRPYNWDSYSCNQHLDIYIFFDFFVMFIDGLFFYMFFVN